MTTMPARHMSGSFTRSTLEWARSSSEVSLEEGHLLQPDWIADYCEGFGLDVNEYLTRWNGEVDYRLTYKGITAFVGAVENQFLGRKSILEKIVPPAPSGWVMHQGSLLYENLDAAGYLTLATDGLYVHHLGNTLTPKWRAVAEKLGLTLTSRGLSASDDWASKLAKSGLARRVLLKSYDGLFRLLYRGVA
ncbi:MAG: hypothetical protein HY023_05950 [Chloroflexi bacterium]|nr:hypothetical protein [Chloroflexota bacterium]